MHGFATASIMVGIAVAYFAQIVGAILVFRTSIFKGVLSLFVPGYFLFALKRQGHYKAVVAVWAAGLAGLVVGTIILS